MLLFQPVCFSDMAKLTKQHVYIDNDSYDLNAGDLTPLYEIFCQYLVNNNVFFIEVLVFNLVASI